MRTGQPVPLDLALDGYLQTPSGHMRYIPRAGEAIRYGAVHGVRWMWTADIVTDELTLCWVRVICLHPRIVERPPWWIRRCLWHGLGHALSGSPSEELARAYQSRHDGTEPEEPILRYTPERVSTDTLLEIVWERHGMDEWDIEERAMAEGVAPRELCLMLIETAEELAAA